MEGDGTEQDDADVEVMQVDGDDEVSEDKIIDPKEHADVPKVSAVDNARVPKSLRSPIRPPVSEVEKHNLTHLPYRHWCQVCVESKGKEDPHPRGKGDDDDKSGLPIISLDYQEMNEELQLRLIIGKDEATGMVIAHQAVCKGPKDSWLMRKIVADMKDMGRPDVVLKTDGEPAIVAVQDEVQSRRSGRTIPRNPAAYNPESNGPCEKAVQDVTGQVRTLKIGLEYRLKQKVSEADAIMQWAIEHAAFLINRYSVGHDGMTPYERLTGRKWNRPLVEFGETVLAKLALRKRQQGRLKKQKHKLSHRSVVAVWVGQIARTGEHVVIKQDGQAVRCRTVKRVPLEQRWDAVGIKEMKAVPRRPNPNGKDVENIEARIAAEEEHGVSKEPMQADEDAKLEEQAFAHRELRITDKVLDKYGSTPNCPGCAAKLGGPTTNRGHTAECRQRIYDAMDKEEDGRIKLEAVKKRMAKAETDKRMADDDGDGPAGRPLGRPQEEEETPVAATRGSKRRFENEPNTQRAPADGENAVEIEADGDAAMGGSSTTMTRTAFQSSVPSPRTRQWSRRGSMRSQTSSAGAKTMETQKTASVSDSRQSVGPRGP